jgi:competence protein ComEC
MEEKKLLAPFITPLIIFALFVFGLGGWSDFGKDYKQDNLLRVGFLNVGQGDAIAISAGDRLFLIDGGPDKSVLGALPLVHPPLQKRLDGLFLTHPHGDHLTGLNYLFKNYDIRHAYLTGAPHTSPDYFEFLSNMKASQVPATQLYAGQKIMTADLQIEVLWPRKGSRFIDINDSSMVLQITYGNHAFLFLGDLSEKKQDILAETWSHRKIMAPKRGFRTSYSRRLSLLML